MDIFYALWKKFRPPSGQLCDNFFSFIYCVQYNTDKSPRRIRESPRRITRGMCAKRAIPRVLLNFLSCRQKNRGRRHLPNLPCPWSCTVYIKNIYFWNSNETFRHLGMVHFDFFRELFQIETFTFLWEWMYAGKIELTTKDNKRQVGIFLSL